MKWWKKLSVKISLFIFGLALLPLLVFGLVAIPRMNGTLTKFIESQHLNIVKNAAGVISTNVAQMVKDIQLICDTVGLKDQLPEDQEWTLQFMLKSFPEVKAFSLFDGTGMERMRVSKDRMTLFDQGVQTKYDPDHVDETVKTSQSERLYRGQNGLLMFDGLIRLMNPVDPRSGYLLKIAIDVTQLLDVMAEQYRNESGILYVVDGDGVILSHPDRSVVLAGEKALNSAYVADFVAQRKGKERLRIYENRHGKRVVASAWETDHLKLLVVFEALYDDAFQPIHTMTQQQGGLLFAVLVMALLLVFYFFSKIVMPVKKLETGVDRIASGVFDVTIPVTSDDEMGKVTKAFNAMAANLDQARIEEKEQSWIQEGVTAVDNAIRGAVALDKLSHDIVNCVCRYVNAHIGLIYIKTPDGAYRYMAGYATKMGQPVPERFESGEGLTGQCVAEKRIGYFETFSDDYLIVSSTLGETLPKELAIIPFVHEEIVEGVIELGSIDLLSDTRKSFLSHIGDRIAVVLSSVRSRETLNVVLEKTHEQNEELTQQQAELQSINEELEEQSQMLSASEAELKKKHEALEQSNIELEEKSQYLENSQRDMEKKNRILETLKRELETKADDLAATSQYKSEFLANMSHELRTPLNSLLLLAKLLCRNKEKNLNEAQLESVNIIYNSGVGLLALINEILDLSKIEAGQMTLKYHPLSTQGLIVSLKRQFLHLAEEKGLKYYVTMMPNCPEHLTSDLQRLEQILKNLIANAIKFTEAGEVSVVFSRMESPDCPPEFIEEEDVEWIAVSIKDTGIGIPQKEQQVIFEAFHQIESDTARKHGGTGLGLSISLKLTQLLGGRLTVTSEAGKGSIFRLFLPTVPPKREVDDNPTPPPKFPDPPTQGVVKVVTPTESAPSSHDIMPSNALQATKPTLPSLSDTPEKSVNAPVLPDDRDEMEHSEKSILIIEDDLNFGKTLIQFCRERGFHCIYTPNGEEGITLADSYQPKGILLDVRLPGLDGWGVLGRLKSAPRTRHIPVHFMSVDEPQYNALRKGAIGYLQKPVSDDALEVAMEKIESMIERKMKELLIVEDDAKQLIAIRKLIGEGDIKIHEAKTARAAIEALNRSTFDCVILDIGLPDMSGFDLLAQLDPKEVPPIIIYTGKNLTAEQDEKLQSFSQSIIIKGVRSEERLLDETSLFLHRVIQELPPPQKQMICEIHDGNRMLKGKKILIVDDDMRNVFALSKVLNDLEMETLKAENGKKALAYLHETEGIDMVLMDIMMPVMDGFETMREIRKEARFAKLPIIALTAKAMKQDKADCIEAGANDYLSKPVDIDHLISLMRVWLYD